MAVHYDVSFEKNASVNGPDNYSRVGEQQLGISDSYDYA